MSEAALRALPSVDAVLRAPDAAALIAGFGHQAVADAVRAALAAAREARQAVAAGTIVAAAAAALTAAARPSLRPVFNLTGTILHTNLGRALIAESAIAAAVAAMRSAVALEFDLDTGKRGERDDHVEALLCALTGAEAATVVNNNAAAVLLVLNSLGKGREALVSRGELIEIGGAFRMPDIMARAGTRLVEVGTTNRTHRKDYAGALGPKTGLILKVHTSNYRITGFTKEVAAPELAVLAGEAGIPLVNDLGSGTLVDLTAYWHRLSREPTVAEAVAEGADIVTFSGDKLLGGPQAGFIVGRKALIDRINRNPMKRALRVDKIRLAAIEATLKLYRDPERLVETVPTLRFLARDLGLIEALGGRLSAPVARLLGSGFSVRLIGSDCQVGSGALPTDTLRSACLAVSVDGDRRGRRIEALQAALRRLPMPVIGRVERQKLLLDLRCLEDEAGFLDNLAMLDVKEISGGLA